MQDVDTGREDIYEAIHMVKGRSQLANVRAKQMDETLEHETHSSAHFISNTVGRRRVIIV